MKGANERKLLKQISATYMSDEETDAEGTGFTVRKLSWRSNLLNRLLSRLDKRYEEQRKNSTLRTKPREKRTLGEFSTRGKPFGAPKWTFQELSTPPETDVSPSIQPPPPPCMQSPIIVQRSPSNGSPGTSQDSAVYDTPTTNPVYHMPTTPSGSNSCALDPTQLFEEDPEMSSDSSDDELETLIRAATMRL